MSAAPPIMQTIGWVRLIQFVGSKGWSVELTEHGYLCLRKDGSVVVGPGPDASTDEWLALIDRLGEIDGFMKACRSRRP
jgi:hypothetical protein